MKRVRLVKRASLDLIRAFDYSLTRFGMRQAHIYTEGLRAKILSLVQYPELGQPASEDAGRTRRLIYRLHIIRYRIHGDDIIILSIMDGRRNSHG